MRAQNESGGPGESGPPQFSSRYGLVYCSDPESVELMYV